jgi:hypothetical protein
MSSLLSDFPENHLIRVDLIWTVPLGLLQNFISLICLFDLGVLQHVPRYSGSTFTSTFITFRRYAMTKQNVRTKQLIMGKEIKQQHHNTIKITQQSSSALFRAILGEQKVFCY